MATGDTIQYAGEYKLRECNLLSSTGVVARLDANVLEINIYESIFNSNELLAIFLIENFDIISYFI